MKVRESLRKLDKVRKSQEKQGNSLKTERGRRERRFEKVRGSWRKSEAVRGSWRKSVKVRGSWRKTEKVRGSLRKSEEVRES